ncbi:allantoate amidohydrolase [Zavarzinia compransoris]|uniref:Allantoate amidohydrolase n=1 Tax=Zavarzinia compransoris TaxID=1264899 RepID=A0A317DZ82_9PROT|nr:allantoate amidohydrolase [Zavarzinia compransoris]PWR19732.1 allantoate amidohydrolase [Zavarzinia compransoris]TDP43320.1 allantoate deiminase [Zavarzinia compransoris]
MSRSLNDISLGARLYDRLEAFARHSEDADRLTRVFLSKEHRAAAEELLGWMRDAGMKAHIDAIGNVVGRYEGLVPNAPCLMMGSHIDTVRDAGKYDGNMGVLAALAAVEEFNKAGERFPFAIEVIAFGDEEGVRFPVTLSGSRAIAGTFDQTTLSLTDKEGKSLRQALAEFGCDPTRITDSARRRDQVLAFVELHIEQGPVLEAAGLPVGAVTAINGASRLSVEVKGTANHAGTVPMHLRRDALAAAAEMMLSVEARGRAEPDLVATVGRVDVLPGAVNVIPGLVRFTMDVRSPSDSARRRAVADIDRRIAEIAAARDVGIAITLTHEAAACRCDPKLIDAIGRSIARTGLAPMTLPSGAGHDAMAFARLCPVGMIFVRCEKGISHNPAEAITVEDADAAMRVLLDFIRHFDASTLTRPAEDRPAA